jgi:ELWxxDGT repeat protein
VSFLARKGENKTFVETSDLSDLQTSGVFQSDIPFFAGLIVEFLLFIQEKIMSTPFLVKDIFPGLGNSSPGYLTAVGNTLFFSATGVSGGKELWKSDGTAAGTVLVKDIRPGLSTSYPVSLTAVGNTLFFRADDGVNGGELWKSDGTAAGTVLVGDIRPGSSGSYPRHLTAVGSTLFFSADNGVNGRELWKSDGTAAGTVLVKDIRPGSSNSYPGNLTAVGNTLFFTADNGVNGRELWKSDGTAAGTVLVKDIRPGSSNSYPSNLTAVGNTLFFTADNGVNGRELWALNVGTPAVPTLTIAATNANQTEGNSGSKAFTFTVTRADNTTGSNNVNWAVTGSGSNPANASDFVGGLLPSGTVSFTTGESSKVITVNIQGDTTVELNENFTVTLSNATNGATITTATATGTIQNDDVAVPTLTIAATNANQTEGNSGSKAFTFTVTRAVNTTGTNNVNWAVTGSGTNPANAADFVDSVLPSGTVSFTTGESSKVITVNIQGDTTVELNENFTVTLSNATNGATITTATATGTIQNDDVAVPTLTIAATNANQTEGNSGSKAFTFTVTRAVNTTGTNNVNWAVTGSGTNPANAADFVDSVLPSGTVSFAPGESSKVITVNVQGDTTVEQNENFTVTLSNATNGATITTATATGTIQNDDVAVPTLTIAATNANQTEGNSGSKAFTFTVTRAVNTTGTNNVNWAVTGSGSNPANASDFAGSVLPSGTVSFAAGETSKVITVNVQGDTTVELNENFTVTLSNATNGATITTATATGTIQNDDFIGTSGSDTLAGTSGADALTGLAGNDTYTVNNAGDLVIEALNQGTDTVQASIAYTLPNNVENLLLTGTVNLNGTGNGLNNVITGNSGNNSLNGAAGNDTLIGGAGNDSLNGAAGIDTLTGGTGTDIFIFQFGQSTAAALDRVTDFAIGTDKIDLLSQTGAAINAPVAFTRAADSTTTNINTIVTNVFIDANGATAGNQALGINSAVLVRDNSSSTYLIINDGTLGFQSANDLVINLTGLTGTLPALGTIAVNSFFV